MNQLALMVVNVPTDNCDVILSFPNGKEIVVQCRPQNADINYNGSLDICFPENETLTLWKDDMEDADILDHSSFLGNQLTMELPYNPDDPTNPNPHENDYVENYHGGNS